MRSFINEYQKKHYEAAMKAQERSLKHPLSAAQLKEQAVRVRAIANAATSVEKASLRTEFKTWVAQGKPVTGYDVATGCGCRRVD